MIDLIHIALALLQIYQSPIGRCDPVDGPKLEWTRDERQTARDLANDSVRERGASPIFVAFLDSVTIRESSAFASRWHDGRTGLGMHGVNITTHAKRWPSPLNPAICDPRVSAAIVQDIAHVAVEKYGASSAWEIQAVFAGRFECVGDFAQDKVCTGRQQDRTTSAICDRMSKRGFSCYQLITAHHLGERMTLDEKRSWTGVWRP